ncbi:hypothetical protein NOVO_00735 [Rickettsiales bacterium Ac37b]|nr:hypothetical protein NOVO_00735 [Rickettsiales bacterium Ac37b]
MHKTLPSELLEKLVCPLTKTPLIYNPERHELVSLAARMAYPIKAGIAIMLREQARKLEDHEFKE